MADDKTIQSLINWDAVNTLCPRPDFIPVSVWQYCMVKDAIARLNDDKGPTLNG